MKSYIVFRLFALAFLLVGLFCLGYWIWTGFWPLLVFLGCSVCGVVGCAILGRESKDYDL